MAIYISATVPPWARSGVTQCLVWVLLTLEWFDLRDPPLSFLFFFFGFFFWREILWLIFWPVFGPPKSNFRHHILPSWSQHVRFWCSTWPPKSTQNRHFFGFKRQLMLRCVRNRPKCSRTYYLQYFVAPGRPNMAPKIVPTSMENGSQEPSMLRPVFSTCQNRLRSPSGAILRRFFNIKWNFWPQLGPQHGEPRGSIFHPRGNKVL